MADALSDKTLTELKKLASDLEIEGRSSMDQEQLIKAIEEARANPGAKPATAAKDAAADVEPAGDEESFDVERLTTEATDFFGVPSHVAAGAFHSINKKSLTITEGKAANEARKDAVDTTVTEA